MIAVEGLTFTYPGGTAPAVRDLTFDVSARLLLSAVAPARYAAR